MTHYPKGILEIVAKRAHHCSRGRHRSDKEGGRGVRTDRTEQKSLRGKKKFSREDSHQGKGETAPQMGQWEIHDAARKRREIPSAALETQSPNSLVEGGENEKSGMILKCCKTHSTNLV